MNIRQRIIKLKVKVFGPEQLNPSPENPVLQVHS